MHISLHNGFMKNKMKVAWTDDWDKTGFVKAGISCDLEFLFSSPHNSSSLAPETLNNKVTYLPKNSQKSGERETTAIAEWHKNEGLSHNTVRNIIKYCDKWYSNMNWKWGYGGAWDFKKRVLFSGNQETWDTSVIIHQNQSKLNMRGCWYRSSYVYRSPRRIRHRQIQIGTERKVVNYSSHCSSMSITQ